MKKISNHKNMLFDDGVRPGGTTSPGLGVKIVQAATLCVVWTRCTWMCFPMTYKEKFPSPRSGLTSLRDVPLRNSHT